jgi:hypothetical protein
MPDLRYESDAEFNKRVAGLDEEFEQLLRDERSFIIKNDIDLIEFNKILENIDCRYIIRNGKKIDENPKYTTYQMGDHRFYSRSITDRNFKKLIQNEKDDYKKILSSYSNLYDKIINICYKKTDKYFAKKYRHEPSYHYLSLSKIKEKYEKLSQLEKNSLNVNQFFDYMKSVEYRVVYSEEDVKRRMKNKDPMTLKEFYWSKGHFFEKDFRDDLINSKLFGKVIQDGSSGKSDIVCFNDIESEIYVFSLKCLNLNNKSRSINPKKLSPEIESCNKFAVDYPKYTISMVVVVLDNGNNRLHIVNNYDFTKLEPVFLN